MNLEKIGNKSHGLCEGQVRHIESLIWMEPLMKTCEELNTLHASFHFRVATMNFSSVKM